MAISKAARTFQGLLVWQKAHQFVLGVYALTATLPKQETYGLSSQMRVAQPYPSPPISPRDSAAAGNRTRPDSWISPRDPSRSAATFWSSSRTSATAIPNAWLLLWKKSADSWTHTPPPF